MQEHLRGTTAITDGVMSVPGSEPNDTSLTIPVDPASHRPLNAPPGDQVSAPPSNAQVLRPNSTGPPDVTNGDADYWHALINEKTAADFLGLTVRWMQSKRQRGGGPKFCRISQRCIRYTRFWLKTYADERLRSSTSDDGETTHAA